MSSDPNYDAATDTYRQIYRGHDNASAVTNSEGLTVFFDPDTHDVLGFQIANFTAYYESHKTEDGEFEVTLPAKVPATAGGGDGLRRRGDPLRRPDRRVLLGGRQRARR